MIQYPSWSTARGEGLSQEWKNKNRGWACTLQRPVSLSHIHCSLQHRGAAFTCWEGMMGWVESRMTCGRANFQLRVRLSATAPPKSRIVLRVQTCWYTQSSFEGDLGNYSELKETLQGYNLNKCIWILINRCSKKRWTDINLGLQKVPIPWIRIWAECLVMFRKLHCQVSHLLWMLHAFFVYPELTTQLRWVHHSESLCNFEQISAKETFPPPP